MKRLTRNEVENRKDEKKCFYVSFKHSENVYCGNLVFAENAEEVEKEYKNYSWYSIKEIAWYAKHEIMENLNRGMPVFEVEKEEKEDTKKTTKKTTKKDIYAKHGIVFDSKTNKILSPVGMIKELLKDGNSKTGKGVKTFSLLAGTAEYTTNINGHEISAKGSCACDCAGCYAKTGCYNFPSVKASLTLNTWLVSNHLDFVYNAISAQLETIGSGEIRIHASRDFNSINSGDYADMWIRIASENPAFKFWTYTKIQKYETLLDNLDNGNIVKSIIPHIGVNFGKCGYIIETYYKLKAMEKSVYVCRCGIDENQHCERCNVCSTYEYVLFIEHSTDYIAEEDPAFPILCEIIKNQD